MSGTSSATSATQAFSSMTRPTRTPTTRPPTTAGNVTSSKADTTARSTGTSNAMTATSPTVEHLTNWKPMGGTSTATIHATASARTTAISHAANAASAGMRFGNRPLEESASIRYHAYINARDKIREALADAVEERDARNPFQCQRDELVTQDMHTCDLCGRRVSSPVYAVHLAYADQAKTASEVCADCMWRLKFSPVRTISLDAYRLFEQWRLSQSEADE